MLCVCAHWPRHRFPQGEGGQEHFELSFARWVGHPAWLREVQSTRNPLQPRQDRPWVARSAWNGHQLHQKVRHRCQEDAVQLDYRSRWNVAFDWIQRETPQEHIEVGEQRRDYHPHGAEEQEVFLLGRRRYCLKSQGIQQDVDKQEGLRRGRIPHTIRERIVIMKMKINLTSICT